MPYWTHVGGTPVTGMDADTEDKLTYDDQRA